MSDRLLYQVVGPVVFGGDGEERLLKAEAADLDLARAVRGVEQRVQRGVGIGRLNLDDVAPHVEADQPGQPEQYRLVHVVQPEREALSPGPRLDLGGRA